MTQFYWIKSMNDNIHSLSFGIFNGLYVEHWVCSYIFLCSKFSWKTCEATFVCSVINVTKETNVLLWLPKYSQRKTWVELGNDLHETRFFGDCDELLTSTCDVTHLRINFYVFVCVCVWERERDPNPRPIWSVANGVVDVVWEFNSFNLSFEFSLQTKLLR